MPVENRHHPRLIVWVALVFVALAFAVSWWHWWTFQYGTFDLAFYVQALWLALRGKWMVSLLNVPLMGNHAEPIVFLMAPLFALCPHPMTLVGIQTVAFGTMPFTAWRIGQRLGLERRAALLLALTTLLTPASLSVAIHEFHPEALAAPLILLLIEARLAERRGWYWLWFLAVLGVKENMAPLLMAFCAIWVLRERKRGRAWQVRWNLAPLLTATVWLLVCVKFIGPKLNAGNVDYLQLYGHLGNSGGDILLKFFTEPSRALHALREALSQGNMVWALLVPFLGLPLLRPQWLLVASPVLLQHLLSWRYTEWSLGAHYPAPLIPLFWIAAAEALTKWRWQGEIAIGVVAACLLAQLRWGAAPELAAEIPTLRTRMEEREWKAAMIEGIPESASVAACLPYLAHLAKREHLVSLHHILKGLKTLSSAAYTPPPPGDVVIIDYGDTMTFSKEAGYYHPKVQADAAHSIPSSDELLHEYLCQAQWRADERNELTVLKRGQPAPPFPNRSAPVRIDEHTTLTALEVTQPLPGALRTRLAWNFSGARAQFPWMMLVLSNGKHLYPFIKGLCAPEANEGPYYEDWSLVFPSGFSAGTYALFAILYDGSDAAWYERFPPDDKMFVLANLPLGRLTIKPGEFGPAPRAQSGR
jgi:uncharacterized membrane protein